MLWVKSLLGISLTDSMHGRKSRVPLRLQVRYQRSRPSGNDHVSAVMSFSVLLGSHPPLLVLGTPSLLFGLSFLEVLMDDEAKKSKRESEKHFFLPYVPPSLIKKTETKTGRDDIHPQDRLAQLWAELVQPP